MDFQTEEDFLRHYNIREFDVPLVTVDNCIFTLHEGQLKVLLVKRGTFPSKGRWALPGGFIDLKRDEDLEACALRKLREKTGVESPYLEQMKTVGNASRDPRGWSVTTVYFALIPHSDLSGSDQAVEETEWVAVDEVSKRHLAFDHEQLLDAALERLRSKVLYTLLPVHLLPEQFTLTELQRAYEIVMGKPLEKKAFRRRVLNAEVLIQREGGVPEGRGRPAALFSLKPGIREHYFSHQLEGPA